MASGWVGCPVRWPRTSPSPTSRISSARRGSSGNSAFGAAAGLAGLVGLLLVARDLDITRSPQPHAATQRDGRSDRDATTALRLLAVATRDVPLPVSHPAGPHLNRIARCLPRWPACHTATTSAPEPSIRSGPPAASGQPRDVRCGPGELGPPWPSATSDPRRPAWGRTQQVWPHEGAGPPVGQTAGSPDERGQRNEVLHWRCGADRVVLDVRWLRPGESHPPTIVDRRSPTEELSPGPAHHGPFGRSSGIPGRSLLSSSGPRDISRRLACYFSPLLGPPGRRPACRCAGLSVIRPPSTAGVGGRNLGWAREFHRCRCLAVARHRSRTRTIRRCRDRRVHQEEGSLP